ncbi:MAG TPA: type VI secretion system contractile sheath large subunit [Bryobacteraceae bacterium]|nr:type VI secretion system contractile sheath large subunit [Bryobacteraceae bacterium]
MPKRYSLGDAVLDVEPGPQTRPEEVGPERPFRVLILGDFTGRASRGVFEPELARRPVFIDRDNFEQVLAKLHPALRLPVPGSESESLLLDFRSLDDFHPDALYDSCEWLHGVNESAPPPPPAAPLPPGPPANLSLDELLDGPGAASAHTRAPDPWDRMLHELVAPHLAPREPAVPAPGGETLSAAMRALLRQPAFQELEAAWRAVFYLVRHVETGADLKLAILDISRKELAADLEASRENLRASATWRLIAGEAAHTPGAEAWSVVAGNYFFSRQEPDLQLLARMGAVAKEGGAPFLGAASTHLLDNLGASAFQQLRSLAHASWIGLAMPRWLLRLPYGAATTPTERFSFEEMERPEHEAYLWGNPAIACACLLAQAFRAAGWQMQPGTARDLEDLPLHVYKEAGEAKVKPCAEILMTEETAEALLDYGIMPLVSFKDRDMVRLLRLQSIADPPAALSGPWA